MIKIQYNSQSLINDKYLLIIESKNSNWCWASRKLESPLCHVVWSTNLKYIFFEKYVVGNPHIKMIVWGGDWEDNSKESISSGCKVCMQIDFTQ